jgi:hypothetical protein
MVRSPNAQSRAAMVLFGALIAGACGTSATSSPTIAPTQTSAQTASAVATVASFPPSTGAAAPTAEAPSYVLGVAGEDADAILAACAVDEAARGFDFAKQADQLKTIQLEGQLGPAQYPFYADLNRTYIADHILRQVQVLSYSLLTSLPAGNTITPADGPVASAFAESVDPAGLANLQVIDVRSPNPSVESDPKYLESMRVLAATFGASDAAQRVALIGLNGSDYEIGFTVMDYSTGWKVLGQSASLTTLPTSGAATPITQEQFEQQTAGS